MTDTATRASSAVAVTTPVFPNIVHSENLGIPNDESHLSPWQSPVAHESSRHRQESKHRG